MCEGQDLPSQDLEVRVNVTHQGLLSISTTSTLPLPTHDHCLQFSHLTSPWGPSVGTGPQWNPLIPPETGGVASNVDFFRGLLSLLSVSGPYTKYTVGLIKIQKAMSLPIFVFKSSRLSQLIGEVSDVMCS